ncbi:MAG: threonyl-tRNA synthetase editing domain-containing protein, partial [Desulfurococcaceae archaeon]
MKLLLIHASKFSYRIVSRAIDEAEEAGKDSLELENVLVVFTTVENGDNEYIVDKAVSEIIDIKNRVKANNILVYPYAHLSNDLAPPHLARELLIKLEEKLL